MTVMIGRRAALGGLAAAAVPVASRAQTVKIVATMPAADAVLSGVSVSGDYYVRFDKPVDHLHSVITIRQDGKVVETLHPRFKTEPNVLFARAPNLAPGQYTMHWSVPTMDGTTVHEGEVPFSVGPRT